MNYCLAFIVVALILAIIHRGEAGTSIVDCFTKLEELAHKAAQMGFALVNPIGNILRAH